MTDATPQPSPSGPSILDTALVMGSLLLIGGGIFGLFVAQVPQANLPIIASLLSFLSGSILGAYAGYRWGASEAMKKPQGSGDARSL